jgi:hypothetical protein
VIQSWNLFIPPLLALLDDPSTPIRSRGLSILTSFLPKMGGELLKRSGLGEVLEAAVIPTLMFLPSITPIDESMQLLGPAYDALFVLADVRWGVDGAVENDQEHENQEERMKLYDRIMRKGILTGYLHAHEHLRIAELLISKMGVLVEKMGIHAVKHLKVQSSPIYSPIPVDADPLCSYSPMTHKLRELLICAKDILPLLSNSLSDPFSSSSPQLPTTIQTLKSVIIACWPRISQPIHRRTILKSLVVCWKNIEAHKTDLDDLKKELKDVAQLFVRSVEATQSLGTDCAIDNEILVLVEADPCLQELFARHS